MREIKFRAWNNKIKIMMDASYGDWICFDGTPYTEASKHYDTPNIEIESTNDYELMQFTGLLDKNGKEIFEGDIVKINGKYNKLVEWNFQLLSNLDMNIATEHPDVHLEIIGNIYEHPELLK